MHRPVPFGKYILLERISVGGMAEVFKGKTFGVEGFARRVAIKRILPHLAEDPRFVEMFINEAKVAVQLNHANIAQVYELGVFENDHYIAMEYVAGKDCLSLQQYTRKTGDRLPVHLAVYVGSRVAEGLGYAHRKTGQDGRPLGIIHRDISPQNVLISYEGAVKLIDFGIAKAAIHSSHQTQAGVLKGKYAYMSPEQIAGKPLDQRSDIFALGTVLHEMLTGQSLFSGDNDFLTLEKVRTAKADPPSRFNPDVPPQLDQIVLRALAREQSQRYQSAAQFADDLSRYLHMSGAGLSAKELKGWMRTRFAGDIAEEEGKDEQFARLTMTAEGELVEEEQAEEDATALWDPLSEDMLPEGMHFEKEEPKPRYVSLVRREIGPPVIEHPDESLTSPSPQVEVDSTEQMAAPVHRPLPPIAGPAHPRPAPRQLQPAVDFGHDDPTGFAPHSPGMVATTTTMPRQKGPARRDIIAVALTLLVAGGGGIAAYTLMNTGDETPASGRVSITVTPDDQLQVAVDGKAVEATTSPFELELPAGTHTLTVARPGYKPSTDELTVAGGDDATKAIVLERDSDAPALLRIELVPPGPAEVKIAGKVVPVDKLKPGVEVPSEESVPIVVTRPGFERFERMVTLKPGQDTTEKLTLKATPATLMIESTPNATIYIDDKRRGRTPATLDNLDPTRPIQVRLEAKDRVPHEAQIEFGTARYKQIEVDLKRK